MKIKLPITGLLVALFALLATSCDDDLSTVGSGIQPDKDAIQPIIDTVKVKAETILLKDSVFAWTTSAFLGKYEDPLFGTVKTDFLTEFYCQSDFKFIGNDPDIDSLQFLGIDSIQLSFHFNRYWGDTITPMGVSVYKVTSPLKRDFYTNVNPYDFCDMTQLLGQKTYSISQAFTYTTTDGITARKVSVNLDKELNDTFYNEWKNGTGFENTVNFRKFFPGVYVTTTFGAGSMVEAPVVQLDIHYRYNIIREKIDSARIDTILTNHVINMSVTPEVILLNSVRNQFVDPQNNPLLRDEEAVYLKTPAGVFTQLQFPLLDIARKIDSISVTNNNDDVSVNAAKLILKGFTEREAEFDYDFGRPGNLLLIEKDSVADFFLNPEKRKVDNKTSFYASWNTTNNTCTFQTLSRLVTAYKKKIDDGTLTEDPYFVLIPVEVQASSSSSSSDSKIYNYLRPSTAVIRNNPKDMRMSLIYTRY